ncbi:hypothetical protein HY497_02450 [Candidatus Woesearchaeota archaeon]|nr:hypothetical protein [Candidatus Woesearchaeota archaeon]
MQYTPKQPKQQFVPLCTAHRGQLEIMGLAVIVVLISLGFFLIVQFMITSSGEPANDQFARQTLAQNTINAMMLTTTTCHNLDLTKLIQDCASVQDVRCNGLTSCAFVEDVADELLSKTLKAWGNDYEFTIVSGDRQLFNPITNYGCPNDRDAGNAFIPSKDIGGDRIFVRLLVC